MDAYQLKAARAMIGFTLQQLSREVDISHEAINKIERGDVKKPRESTIEVLTEFFKKHGIEFLDDSGVRMRTKKLREIVGKDCFIRLLDDVFYTLQRGEEVLISHADDRKSPAEVNDSYRRIRSKGIRMRQLIEEGNTYIMGPLHEYRCLKTEHFHNSVSICYGTKTAFVLDNERRVLIIDDEGASKANRNTFNALWEYNDEPTESTANEKF